MELSLESANSIIPNNVKELFDNFCAELAQITKDSTVVYVGDRRDLIKSNYEISDERILNLQFNIELGGIGSCGHFHKITLGMCRCTVVTPEQNKNNENGDSKN